MKRADSLAESASLNAPGRQQAAPNASETHPRGRLQLSWVVRQLMADGLMASVDGERVLSLANRSTQVHPIAALAEMNLRSADASRTLLNLERLTEWLAGKSGLPYQHIDPLRVDFTRIVEVMQVAYATTYSIVPIAVQGAEVTVATSEPFVDGWVREIEQHTKKSIKRVVANPVDLRSYLVEFYNLAQ